MSYVYGGVHGAEEHDGLGLMGAVYSALGLPVPRLRVDVSEDGESIVRDDSSRAGALGRDRPPQHCPRVGLGGDDLTRE